VVFLRRDFLYSQRRSSVFPCVADGESFDASLLQESDLRSDETLHSLNPALSPSFFFKKLPPHGIGYVHVLLSFKFPRAIFWCEILATTAQNLPLPSRHLNTCTDILFMCPQDRLKRPEKRWKLSPIDLYARSRWSDYSYAKDVMFSHTDTSTVTFPQSPISELQLSTGLLLG
jgi:hypothetical protein